MYRRNKGPLLGPWGQIFARLCLVIIFQNYNIRLKLLTAVKDLPQRMKLVLLDFGHLNLGKFFLLVTYLI